MTRYKSMLNRQVERPHNTTFSRKRCFFLDLLRRRDLFHLIILLFSFVEYHDIGKQQESQKNIDPRKMSTSGKILCRLRPEYLNHESIKLDPKIVNDVDTMLMFIGYPRSGHTLIGSLLDAHPNMVVANEYNILGNWENYTTKHRNKQYLFEQLYTKVFSKLAKVTGLLQIVSQRRNIITWCPISGRENLMEK